MSSTNKTTYYELSQYVGTDKPTYLGDYNSDMLAIDTAIHEAATDASAAVSTANAANSTATTASSNASSALSTANSALETANTASTTATTASNNASAALTAAEAAETAAAANTITNLAPAYDPTLTYEVGDLVTYIDDQGSGKLYKCIVAVSTPEAFNINKWDDITVSELLGGTIIASVSADGVKTTGAILNELYNAANNNIVANKNYKLEVIYANGDRAISNISQIESTNLRFSSVNVNASNTVLTMYYLSTNSVVYKTVDNVITTSDTDYVPTNRSFAIIEI